MLQLCVSDDAPEHDRPLYCGAGFVQLLVLPWVPPPHVTLHVAHDVQEVYPPFTENISHKNIKKLFRHVNDSCFH